LLKDSSSFLREGWKKGAKASHGEDGDFSSETHPRKKRKDILETLLHSQGKREKKKKYARREWGTSSFPGLR